MDRAYYSQRIGRGPLSSPTIEDLARALTLTVDEMWQRDYLQQWHGFHCVDAGDVDGRAAMPLADHIEAETGWRSVWPLPEPLIDLSGNGWISDVDWNRLLQEAETKLFDLIGYFHDHVSQGIEGDVVEPQPIDGRCRHRCRRQGAQGAQGNRSHSAAVAASGQGLSGGCTSSGTGRWAPGRIG